MSNINILKEPKFDSYVVRNYPHLKSFHKIYYKNGKIIRIIKGHSEWTTKEKIHLITGHEGCVRGIYVLNTMIHRNCIDNIDGKKIHYVDNLENIIENL